MCLLVLGLDLMFCGESLNGVCIISTERVSVFLCNSSQFSPWIIFYTFLIAREIINAHNIFTSLSFSALSI